MGNDRFDIVHGGRTYAFSVTHWPDKFDPADKSKLKRPEMVDLRCSYGNSWCEVPIVFAPKKTQWDQSPLSKQVLAIIEQLQQAGVMSPSLKKLIEDKAGEIVNLVQNCRPKVK